jgi:hypothetical protein
LAGPRTGQEERKEKKMEGKEHKKVKAMEDVMLVTHASASSTPSSFPPSSFP